MRSPALLKTSSATVLRGTVLLMGWTAWACSSPYPTPPDTRQEEVVETLHGVAFRDPYRWLEDQQSPQTRAWITRQNAYAESIIGETPLRNRIRRRLKELMEVEDMGSLRRGGDFEYFTLRRKGQSLPVIYRRPTPPENTLLRIDPTEDYETVLDPHGMSPGHTTRFHMEALSKNGKWMIYSIRDGGRDEVELRVRDLENKLDLEERYPRALYDSPSFSSDGKGFFYVRRSRQTGPRVHYHTIGTPIEEDREIFGEGNGPTCFLRVTQAEEDRYLIFTVQHGWVRHEIHFRDTLRGRTRPIVTDLEAHFEPRYHTGRLLVRTDFEAPNYRIVAIDPDKPGPEHWQEIIPEGSDVLHGYSLIEDRIYATYLHNVSTRIQVFELDGTPAGEIPIPEFHSAEIREAGKGKAFLTLTSLLTPATVYLLDLERGKREIWRETSVPFEGADYVVKQVWCTSRDGTRVPMFVVHRPGIELDGNHPTLLYGYGGFNVSLTPRFSARTAAWLESGGVFAMANLRGGSEFGERWHRAGMVGNKQNVFDDFIAAAEWLVEEGYTNPGRLALYGASNGGLLVASALTQRPQLFRAVLCAFPDLDMVRFYTFTETNNMPALLEYGNAADPEQFEFLRLYSPYQKVRQGVPYPAVMLTSGDLDTRVPPLQARKMTARLQAATRSGLPVILRYHPKAGHAAARGLPLDQVIEDRAAELTFLLSQLGVPAR